jgi:hypothetical protein
MMRLVRVATMVACSFLAGAGLSQAQASAATSFDESRVYLEVNVGGTFGHNTSASFGGEAGIRVMKGLDVFLEGGRMKNIGSNDLDARGQKIATAVGAVSTSHYEVNFGDLGIRYRPPMTGMVHPYVSLGGGLTQVRSVTTFAVAGATVTPESLGILPGSDLEGALKKPILMIGGGAMVMVAKRFFADGSIRYGRIFPKTSQIENDVAINTVRVQIGIGVKF